MINTLDDTDFDVKVDFCGGRKTRESRESSSESDWDQPISARVQAQDQTQVTVVGGMDVFVSLTPGKLLKFYLQGIEFDEVNWIDPKS